MAAQSSNSVLGRGLMRPAVSRAGRRLPRVSGSAAATAVGGAALGAAALAAGSNLQLSVLLILLAAAPIAVVVVGDLRLALLALVILELPLQWDVNLGWHDDLAQLGAIAGLNVSLLTPTLGALYALWAADWLGGS